MNTQTLINEAYAAFNRRDVEGTLALMTETVSWPKASEGGRVTGKEEIGRYWRRQWANFDPHVEVLKVIERENGRAEVKVRQIVRTLEGDVLSDSELWHIHTIEGVLIARMDILEADGNTEGQSAAFSGPDGSGGRH